MTPAELFGIILQLFFKEQTVMKESEDKELKLLELLEGQSVDANECANIICTMPQNKAGELSAELLKRLAELKDFNGLSAALHKIGGLQTNALPPPAAIAALLSKAAGGDRLKESFATSAGFGTIPLQQSLERLDMLISLHPGMLVLNASYGLGEVKKLDYFYKRVTVDFPRRKGHQVAFQAVCEVLQVPAEDHILVTQRLHPEEIEKMRTGRQGELVIRILKSIGPVSKERLETYCAENGLVKTDDWKDFWTKARAALSKKNAKGGEDAYGQESGGDKKIYAIIPVKRTDPIKLVEAVEEKYEGGWYSAFTKITDPKEIMDALLKLKAARHFPKKEENPEEFSQIEARMAFAIKAMRNSDNAMYARLAALSASLGLENPPAQEMRDYLWEADRFLSAGREMPARDVRAMLDFLTEKGTNTESRDRLLAKLPEMNYQTAADTLTLFKNDEACKTAVCNLLKSAQAPAVLTTNILERYEEFAAAWADSMIDLENLMISAIVLGEGRQSGEALKMQNKIRSLFSDEKWLSKKMDSLPPDGRESVFERFQASYAWDPSSHNGIIAMMTAKYPELRQHVFRPAKSKASTERITSFRSYAERKAQYLKLINEDMPANVKRIEFAKSYGDLSENAEYQYAKDEQRALLQKQSIMQDELNKVKPVDFAGVEPDKVRPGTMVELKMPDGSTKVYTVLGEWDSDETLGIIANKSLLASNMLNKTAGASVEVLNEDGTAQTAIITAVRGLSEEILEWTKIPLGMAI